MSAGGGGDSNQDFDLNLAPIIDCFTVLITYLLVSASFISLNALDVGVATNGEGAAATAGETPVSLELQLKSTHNMEIHLTGGKENLSLTVNVPAAKNEWNINGLGRQISSIQAKYASLKEATVKADPGVQYKDVIKTIETLKKTMGKVYLSQ
jgi:biopolymer transport protein ExbD